ncbi:P-loop containing nucleoside triphosphate hydrolase protein [Xylariaceae sp. FL0662B]|nr:P-loop containing nucleoside triphosphate hydrolase protein [Xylariaceae sp. FL0662B]
MSDWDNFSGMKAALPKGAPSDKQLAPSKPIKNWGERVPYVYTEDDSGREWGSNSLVYEWDGEQGDIGPENPKLEVMLFGRPDERDPQGIDFSKVLAINVVQEGIKRITPISDFNSAGLHPAMLKNVKLAGYRIPTPIQRYCVPAIKMGYDLIAIAQTGSGKTAAYLIPILDHLMGKTKKLAAPRPSSDDIDAGRAGPVRAEPLVVVVCPARELAIQIFNEARKFCYRSMLRPCVLYGGGPVSEQIRQLQRGCDILVASPGRLIHMMERPDVLTLRRVRYMVIDEADEMLDEDWREEFDRILTGGEQEEGNVKYMLFSATFPRAVRHLARNYLAESHIRLSVGRVGSTHENIKQDIIYVDPSKKKQALEDLLCSMDPSRTIVFVNSKQMAEELDDFFWHMKIPCTSIHSDRTQREREDAMRAFRAGTAPLLVTTGVAARGIDVRNVMCVINYDLPSMDHGGIREYIHRIGRTGRIGHHGLAVSFYTERDEGIAALLTLTLLENKQEVPDFLQGYIPQGVKPEDFKFEDDTDDEKRQAEEGGGAGGSWSGGAGEGGWGDAGGSGGQGWGSSAGPSGGKTGVDDAGGSGGQGWGSSAGPSGGKTGGDDAWGSGGTGGGDAWGSGGDFGGGW